MILRLVSMRQLLPFSTRSMVSGETPAFLASSALLIRRVSRIPLTKLRPNFPSTSLVVAIEPCPIIKHHTYIVVHVKLIFYKLVKLCIIYVYIVYTNYVRYHILCRLPIEMLVHHGDSETGKGLKKGLKGFRQTRPGVFAT